MFFVFLFLFVFFFSIFFFFFFFFFFFIFFFFEEMAHDVTVEATLRAKGVGSSTKAVFVILKEVAGVPEV